jgi:cyclohexadienyl dehydratase
MSARRAWQRGLVLVCALGAALAAHAAPPLRVAVTGDYPPLSARSPDGDYVGFDADVARMFAATRGSEVEWVPLRWPELPDALAARRFDVAMTGVTVRPDRSIAGVFTVPVLESGAVVLARDEALGNEEDLAKPGVPLAVNAGGHLERVARALFPLAAISALPDNSAVRDAFASGTAGAVVTDTVEAPSWRALVPGARQLGPFTRDVKAYWLPPDRAPLAAELDTWLQQRESDGSLARLRAQWLGAEAAQRPTAQPTLALIAALAERFALMPAVAAAKRASGAPVLAPEREAALLAAAVLAAQSAARRERIPAPEQAALEAFFVALFETSRAVQSAALAGPPADPSARVYDLDAELRPALTRVTERIAALLPRLPARLSESAIIEELGARCADLPGFGEAERARVAAALAQLASAKRH